MESRDSKKKGQIQNNGWKDVLDAREIVKLRVEDEVMAAFHETTEK